ncbi:MAG TPA: tripartite tricarboxylate transporter substrate-binding protein [Candidatus Binatia bacterium]
MKHRKHILWTLAALCVAALGPAPADAAEETFYKGKTIRVVIGTTPGALYDQWARVLAAHMGKHIPGNPDMVPQNMPGAGHKIAANYVYKAAKPDGLTLIGSIVPSLYFDQLLGKDEVQYDWPKFTWIGSPVKGESQMYMRADTPYKTMDDVRKAAEPPRCGTQSTSESAYFLPRLFADVLGTKFKLVSGYPGGPEIDLAVERGEIHCRAFTVEAFFAREPYLTWYKNKFVRNIVQTGRQKDPRLADTPTIYELMDRYKTPDAGRRLATVMLAADELGRPMLGSPGIPADRVKILREAFEKTMKDPGFLAEVAKRKYELSPTRGEELERIARESMAQPADIIQRMKKVLEEEK